MKFNDLKQIDEHAWELAPTGTMRVPAVLYAGRELVEKMDDKVFQQLANVASLPGIQSASYAMPDAHWGYGFPIGGVAAFDADEGGVVSAGGVGFDISCGVRALLTGLTKKDVVAVQERLAEALFRKVPAGLGTGGRIALSMAEMDAMLQGGASWAVKQGYGQPADLERIEERGVMAGAVPSFVSDKAKQRQQNEMGTLGSGNHYLEVQHVTEIYDEAAAAAFGLKPGDVVVSIHCGSRGLGHQIGSEFLKRMVVWAEKNDFYLPDRELACAPIHSDIGREYLGAMRAGINCALANRQIITHLVRQAFQEVFSTAELPLLYDVSHNTCKVEEHSVDGAAKNLFVHRKGATRAFGPGHHDLPQAFRDAGQPVLVGGTMGTASYVLAGMAGTENRAFSSACHGAGRSMSRSQALRQWQGRDVLAELASRGIIVKSRSMRALAEEAPGAYKDVIEVVDSSEAAGLARKVARLEPLICVKG